ATVSVTGKNLFDKNSTDIMVNTLLKEDGTLIGYDGYNVTGYIKVYKGDTIINTNANSWYGGYYDVSKRWIKSITENGPTFDADGYYRVSYGHVHSDTVQIEEGSTPTPYEPYKHFSQTLYLDEPLYMSNELCVHDGKLGYWKNVFREKFNGLYGAIFTHHPSQKGVNTLLFTTPNTTAKPLAKIICDKFQATEDLWANITDYEGISITNSGYLQVRIDKSKLSTQDLFGFKEWLQANPITVIYELTEPIFVPILENTPQWILESFNECSVQFETNVPLTSIEFKSFEEELAYLEDTTEYVMTFTADNAGEVIINLGGTEIVRTVIKGYNKLTVTTPLNTTKMLTIDGVGINIEKVVVAKEETNGYFEGMKSVGELDGNIVELTGAGKNLFDDLTIVEQHKTIQINKNGNDLTITGSAAFSYVRYKLNLKPNSIYIFSRIATRGVQSIIDRANAVGIITPDGSYKFLNWCRPEGHSYSSPIYTGSTGQVYIDFYGNGGAQILEGCSITYSNIQLEEVTEGQTIPTTYIPHKTQSKPTQLLEPLRGLPNGIRDKYVRKDCKWFVERNCKKLIIDSDTDILNYALNEQYPDVVGFYIELNDNKPGDTNIICNLLPHRRCVFPGHITHNLEGVSNEAPYIKGNILRSKCKNLILPDGHINQNSIRDYFTENNVEFIYILNTPTYEEIKDPTLITYLDKTHISTNTIIPCNKVVKNAGIECMLKPSTMYSIYDTVKGTGTPSYELARNLMSTNKVTTPANIWDPYLRLYGKGLTSKDVVLLEGDRNRLPYFEGMKSCFEDCKVTQEMVDAGTDKLENLGKYKYGLKVTGKNKWSPEIVEKLCKLENWVGTAATPYEPYRESILPIYSDEPLYKDNKVCIKDGSLGYWKNRERIVLGDLASQYLTIAGNNVEYTRYCIASQELLSRFKYSICNCDKLPSTNTINIPFMESISTSTYQNYIYLSYKSGNIADIERIDYGRDRLKNNPLTIEYELAEPVFVPLIENMPKWILESFKDGSISIDSLIPIASSLYSYTGNVPSVYGLEKDLSSVETQSMDNLALSFDTDFRLCEVEWALEDQGILTPIDVFKNLINFGGITMAMSRYEQAKTLILAGNYNRTKLTMQLKRHHEQGNITTAELEELLALMDARELVEGK
ncbi:MAG: hypothetical protein ACRCTZ_09360, partial [Sarcina sp.]